MRIEHEHLTHKYRAPKFAPPQSPIATASRALLGRAQVTLGGEPHSQTGDVGDRAIDIARQFEDLRFELVTRKLVGDPLTPNEQAVLAAINAALFESMVRPDPEPGHVRTAVEEAQLLLARKRNG